MTNREDLVARAQRGEKQALDELLKTCSPVVRRYLERMIGKRLRRFVSISDLEQEVMMQGLQGLGRVPEDADVESFHALLLTHARWAVGKAVRRNMKSAGESEGDPGELALHSRSMGTVTRSDEIAWLRAQLETLPDGPREVVRRRLRGWTFKRIAAELGIGEDTVRKRFLAAARGLRTRDQPEP